MTPLERVDASPLPFARLLGNEFLSVGLDAIEARMVVRPDLYRVPRSLSTALSE